MRSGTGAARAFSRPVKRETYLKLAADGLRMPIGTDLVLKEKADHEGQLLDGARLGATVVEAARRFRTPLAFPLMDLKVEKQDLLTILGLEPAAIDTHHFEGMPPSDLKDRVVARKGERPVARLAANCEAIARVAAEKDLVAVGMVIGPFSLMTKLLADPITGVYLLASGSDEEEALAVEAVLELGTEVVLRSIRLQAAAGARAVCLCEPACNLVYLSPIQLEADPGLLDRLAIRHLRRIREEMRRLDVDLILHDCGELTDDMVRQFGELDPAVLSLGCSRKLWEDAARVPKTTVLFGNLPSKKFYSDNEITAAQVAAQSRELLERMRAVGHPFILGSECDVLSVPGCESVILGKVEAMLKA